MPIKSYWSNSSSSICRHSHTHASQQQLFASRPPPCSGDLPYAPIEFIQFLLLPRFCWIAHERRRDLARSDGSWDRASMMFQPCFLAVETKERISAKSIAPCSDRKPPEIF